MVHFYYIVVSQKQWTKFVILVLTTFFRQVNIYKCAWIYVYFTLKWLSALSVLIRINNDHKP
jgi:hypothetical protein